MPADVVVVRAATVADAPAIQSIYAPIVLETVASFEEAPPDIDEIARRMVARPRLPWVVAEVAGRPAGYAYASRHQQRHAYRWSAESSVYLDTAYRGRGIARALYKRLLTEVTELGYVSIFAGIVLPNGASVAVHEALGFTAIGVFPHVGFKHEAWRDVGWWQRPLRDLPGAPDEPREWAPGDQPPTGS